MAVSTSRASCWKYLWGKEGRPGGRGFRPGANETKGLPVADGQSLQDGIFIQGELASVIVVAAIFFLMSARPRRRRGLPRPRSATAIHAPCGHAALLGHLHTPFVKNKPRRTGFDEQFRWRQEFHRDGNVVAVLLQDDEAAQGIAADIGLICRVVLLCRTGRPLQIRSLDNAGQLFRSGICAVIAMVVDADADAVTGIDLELAGGRCPPAPPRFDN